jgi:hypothetical protein
MYKQNQRSRTSIKINKSTEGESIETKIERMISNKEKVDGEAQLIYTERKEGVNAAYNPRTDRFEIAIDAKEKMVKAHTAKRDSRAEMKVEKGGKEESAAQPIQGEV